MNDRTATLSARKSQIAELASTLTTPYQLAYSLSCCERLLPYYGGFARLSLHSEGNAVRLREMTNALWSALESTDMVVDTVRDLESALDKIAGDLDRESGTPYARPALVALSAVQCALRVAQNQYEGAVKDMVEHSLDGIDSYLYDVTFPWIDYPTQAEYQAFCDWLLDSQMVHVELKKQHADPEVLSAQEKLTSSFIEKFRAEATSINLLSMGPELFDR